MDLDEVPEEDEEEEGDGRDVLNRFKGDLFDSDDEDAPGEKSESAPRALLGWIANKAIR